MRLATYNVDNLFDRPLAFRGPGHEDEKDILESYARIGELLARPSYADVKQQIAAELLALGLGRSDEGKYAILRQNHGRLIARPRDRPLEVLATGRDDWVGSIELTSSLLPDAAVMNTGRVIADVGADVQAVVEVESRSVLKDFAAHLVAPADRRRYEHAMVIRGNDPRPIDVGVLSRHGWEITGMRSHVDDKLDGKPIFSRDCMECTLKQGDGAELVLLVNHLKSQGYGDEDDNNAKRKHQATRVAEIYGRLRSEGHEHVVVLGDLNDAPDSDPLTPLLSPATDLRDAMECETFDDGASDHGNMRGTYDEGREQLDYILLSPALFGKLRGAGIYRRGTWTKRGQWDMYPSIHAAKDAASDHALVYADIEI